MQIPIVFITDNNYALPTGVAITSLIINKKPETKYKIHIIVTNEVTAENKEKLLASAKENASIELIEVDTGFLEKYKNNKHPVPPCGLLKYKIPSFFSQYEKIIYLDGDIFIKDDLTDFFKIDIKNFYLSAVSDFPTNNKWCFSYKRLYLNDYFNSGVLLINSKLMIENNFEELAFRLKKENTDLNLFMDQDIFNLAAREKVLFCHVKYNALVNIYKLYFDNEIKEFNMHYNTLYNSYDELYNDAVILHFAANKPWKDKKAFYFNEWFEYFKKSSFKDEELNLEN